MLPILFREKPILSFFLISKLFFNSFFFLHTNLNLFFEFLWTFSYFKISPFLKSVLLNKNIGVGQRSKFYISKFYKNKIYKKNSTLKLKSFFFLKYIKKIKIKQFFKKTKYSSSNLFLSTLIPLNLFKILYFFKKNKITFVGLPFFKNYNKFNHVHRISYPKHFSKNNRIRLWKFKKVLQIFKKNKNKNSTQLYFFLKKTAYLLFSDSDNFFFKDKRNYIKIKNLTYDFKNYNSFFFLSPVKFFFLKKKIYERSFRNFKKMNKSGKPLDINERLKDKLFFRKFKLKFKLLLAKLKQTNKLINVKKNIRNKVNFINLDQKLKFKLRPMSRKINSIKYKLKKSKREHFWKNKKYRIKNFYWSDYRFKFFKFGIISPLSFFTEKNTANSFNLNFQKLKNFYKNDFLFKTTQISSNFYLNFYKFFFFQQNKLSKKKKKIFFFKKIKFRKNKLQIKKRRNIKKLLFLKRKKKKLFFLKNFLNLSFYKRYNFLNKKKFYFFKNNFQNFNKKFSKFYLSKFLKVKKNNFFFNNKKKLTIWSLLLNNNSSNLKKKINKSDLLLKKKHFNIRFKLRNLKKLKNRIKYNFKFRLKVKNRNKRRNKYGRFFFKKHNPRLSIALFFSHKIFKIKRSSANLINVTKKKKYKKNFFKKWNFYKKELRIERLQKKYTTRGYLRKRKKFLKKKNIFLSNYKKHFNKRFFNNRYFNRRFFNKLFRFKKYSKKKKLKLFFSKFFFRAKIYKKKFLTKKKKNFYSKNFFLIQKNNNFFKNTFLIIKKIFFKNYFNWFNFILTKDNNNSFKNTLFFSNKDSNFFIFELKSKLKNVFILNSNGFMYLTNLNSVYFFRKEKIWVIRKIIYSFASKNDLQNFILRKYIKSNHFAIKDQSKKNNLNSFLLDLNPYDFKLKYIDWGLTMKPKFFEKQYEIINNNLSLNEFFSYSNTQSPDLYNSLYTFNLSTLGWSDFILEPFYLKSLKGKNFDFNIRKTKFKPGYSTMWRNYRSTLKATLNLKFRYQKRLTNYLLKFNKIIKNRLYFLFEMQLENVLTLSKFFPDRAWTTFFINEGLVFLNNKPIFNNFEQLFKNDFVQLSVSLKYYIVYRWLLNWHVIKKNKLKKRLNSKINAKYLPDDKQKSRNLPIWLLKYKNLKEDVSRYLEVDYLTLSFFVIYEPMFLTDINPLSFLSTKFSIINLFNWKYIN